MTAPNTANLPVQLATPDQYPSGFVYVENFLSPDEQNLILQIIDEHGFDQHVHRKQQFFGPKYYHTPQSYRAELQPVDESLATKVLGQQQTLDPEKQTTNAKNSPNACQSDPQSSALSSSSTQLVPPTDLIGAKNLRHGLGPFQWLIDKLLAEGLFERADVRDPFVEYINNNNIIQRVERTYIDPQSNPLSEPEITLLNQILSTPLESRPQWGEDTPYPDQILVNEYLVGQNIGQHFDDQLCFGPLIVGVSCGDDCTLILSRPQCIGSVDKKIRNFHEANRRLPGSAIQHDIEDLDAGFFACHYDDFSTQLPLPSSQCPPSDDSTPTPTAQTASTSPTSPQIPLSYPLSLRDFSRKSWQEGESPSVLGAHCKCTRERAIQQFSPYGKLMLDPKRRKEWVELQQFPQFAPGIAKKFYNTTVFFEENLKSDFHPYLKAPTGDLDIECSQSGLQSSPSTSSINTSVSMNSVTGIAVGNANARKRPADPVLLRKALQRLQFKIDKLKRANQSENHRKNNREDSVENNAETTQEDDDINAIIDNDLSNAPEYVRDLIDIILNSKHHPTTEEEMSDFIMSFNFETLLEQYYATTQPEKSISLSEIRREVKAILSPSLVDINTCMNCDDTLYIPVKKGSVYVLAGASRYHYRHAIKKPSKTEQKGNPNYRRVSLTVRSLLPGRRQVEKNSEADHGMFFPPPPPSSSSIAPQTIDE